MARRWIADSMNVDEVLQRIGGLGATQRRIFLIVGLPHIWISFQVLSSSYVGTDPGWNCTRPLSGVRDHRVYDSVDVRTLTDIEVKCAYYEQGDCVPQYSKEYTSIVTEWDLICSRAHYPAFSQSGFFVGLLIGGLLCGSMSDTYGRKNIFFLSLFGAAVCHVCTGLAPVYSIYFLLRILLGVFVSGVCLVGYTLLVEVISTSKRSIVGIAIHQFAPIGTVVLAMAAYYIREWRTLLIISGLSEGLFLAAWRMTPESPRWLLTQGREEKAVATLAWMARGNGQMMPDYKLQNSVEERSAGHHVSMLDLFRGRTIRHRTLVLAIAWFTNCIVYYALALNAGTLGSGRYLPFVLFGLIEMPIYCITCVLINRLGRRGLHGFLLTLSGVFCLAWSLADWSGASLGIKTTVALLGKMAVSGSFGIIYLYSAELFPTQVRST